MNCLKFQAIIIKEESMLEYWFKLDDKIRFVLVGGFNFCVSYLIYVLFCRILGVEYYQHSLALSWLLSSIVSFMTQKYFVFKGSKNWIKEYLKCCSTWAVSYFINVILLEVFVKWFFMNVYLSQFIATTAVAIITYILFKKFAFRN